MTFNYLTFSSRQSTAPTGNARVSKRYQARKSASNPRNASNPGNSAPKGEISPSATPRNADTPGSAGILPATTALIALPSSSPTPRSPSRLEACAPGVACVLRGCSCAPGSYSPLSRAHPNSTPHTPTTTSTRTHKILLRGFKGELFFSKKSSPFTNTHRSTPNTPPPPPDHGGILVLLALLAATLITFIALALDLTLLTATRRDQSQLAPTVATAAINAYSEAPCSTPPGPCPSEKLSAAKDRSENMAQEATNLSTTTAFIKSGAYTHDISTNPSTPGATGYIQAGTWHFLPTFAPPIFDPTTFECIGPQPCPCTTGNLWNGPCFQPLNETQQSTNPDNVTSFHSQIQLRADKPFQAKFAKAVNMPHEFFFNSTATVAIRPLRTVIIVDLSRSSHQETHLPFEMVGGGKVNVFNAAEYAFRVGNAVCSEPNPPNLPLSGVVDTAYATNQLTCKPVATSTYCPAVSAFRNPPNVPSTCAMIGGSTISGTGLTFNGLYNHFCPSPSMPAWRDPLMRFANFHSKPDYRCYPITFTQDIYNTRDTFTSHYLVDLYRGPTKNGTTATGPEPLNTMLRGVTHALQRLQARNVVGDMISVIGVDQNADIDIRTFGVGPTYALTRAKVGEPVFDEMLATFTDPPNLHKLHRDHFFFPREDAMFNLPEALRVAFTKLTSQPDYKMSDNNVIVLTDGLTECYKDASDKNICATDQPTIEASLQQAIDYVQAQYIAAGIRFSVILTGGVVRPHTVGRKSQTFNSCMSNKEARETGIVVTDDTSNSQSLADSIAAASADSATGALAFDDNLRYFAPNRLFSVVVRSDGIWAPLREPCQPQASQLLNGKTCGSGGLKEWLDTQCAALTTPGERLSSILGSGGIPTRITDADGRIVCDPQCRTRNQQIRDYIDEIFDSNPYLELDQNVVVN